MSGREDLRDKAAGEVDRYERLLGDELTRLFDRQQAVVLARLQGTKARKHTRHWEPAGERKIDPHYVVDAVRWVKDAAGSVAPVVRRIYNDVWARVSKQLGGGDADADSLDDAVQKRLDSIAIGVQSVTDEVSRFIESEEESGKPMGEIADGVRDLYAKKTDGWVARITTVSAVGAVNHAALSAAFNAGSVSKQWLSRRDDKVRDTHMHADGQVRPILGKFQLGGIPTHLRKSALMFPGDVSDGVPLDEVMNCRCTMLFAPPTVKPGGGPRGGIGIAGPTGVGSVVASLEGLGLIVGTAAVAADAAAVSSSTAATGSATAASEAVKGYGVDETKDRVRTAAGAAHYGQPVGSVIMPNAVPSVHFSAPGAPSSAGRAASSRPSPGQVIGKIAGQDVDLAGGDPSIRALVAKYSPGGLGPDPAKTQVAALRGKSGRAGAYVVWQTQDGDQPKGTILAVSVHPTLQGHGLGNDLVKLVAAHDPDVKVTTRPKTTAQGAVPSSVQTRPMPGLPTIKDRTQSGDRPGTSGDFDADAARIERLQKAYMRDRVDTQTLFARGGRWSRDREKAQQEIIDHFLTRPGVKKDKRILVVGGLPGSGKTTSINSPAGQQAVGIDLSEFVTVNADEVKSQMIARGMVPDYPGLSADEAATLYHAESFEIAHSLMRQAAKRNLNFAYDTSLKSTGQVGFATSAGSRTSPPPWHTTLVLVDVPIKTAKDRAKARYLAGDRYMPLGLIDGMKGRSKGRSAPSENFDLVKRQADQWVVFDNSGAAPVVTGQGGKRAKRP